MNQVQVLLPSPSRAEVDAARDILTRQGFRGITFGDLLRHRPGQRLEADIVAVLIGWPAERAARVARDCTGKVLVLDDIAELSKVAPDRDGRPSMPQDVATALPPRANGSADMPLSRKELFKRAREAGVRVHVSMRNEQLAAAVAQAEGR